MRERHPHGIVLKVTRESVQLEQLCRQRVALQLICLRFAYCASLYAGMCVPLSRTRSFRWPRSSPPKIPHVCVAWMGVFLVGAYVLKKCTYMHACGAFTNGQSLWGPLLSAVLLFRHIVPGHRNRSSPLPLNRPKTKPCQAS